MISAYPSSVAFTAPAVLAYGRSQKAGTITRRRKMREAARVSFTTLLCACACACATGYPVYMRVESSGEEFIGQADSTVFRKSTVRLTNAQGLTCTGEYQAVATFSAASAVTTTGTIVCPDGRVGTWVVTGDGGGGQGVGNLNGEKIRAYFGSFVSRQQLERP